MIDCDNSMKCTKPNCYIRFLILVIVMIIVSVAGFTLWRHWYREYSLESFSTRLFFYDNTSVVENNGDYIVTVEPSQELELQLYLEVALAKQHAGTTRGVSIRLIRQELHDGYSLISDTRQKSQSMEFDNGDIVRYYWMSESIDSNRTAIHSVALHFREGRLIDTKVDEIQIELQFENAEEGN